jgi:glucose/arabinose dehydrogenase
VRHLALLVIVGCGGGSSTTDGGPQHGDGPLGDGPIIPMVDADPACANPGTIPTFGPHQIVSGLTQPVFTAQPAGSTDLYVVEKGGRIKLVRGGAVVSTFLDVTATILIPNSDAEGGLVGLEFAKDYATSGRFWVYGTFKAAGSMDDRAAIQEFHHTSGNTADATVVRELISYHQDGFNSLGGTIRFGPDHYLWLATGDAASMPSTAQDLTNRGGKILRVDVDNPTVPPPNGLGGAGVDPYIWDYGLRNPFRFSFDRLTHELYLADAGETRYEEVDIEQPGVGHHDFGWDRMEGTHCANGTTSCGAPGTLPQYDHAHASSYSVIIGGTVYRGSALPCLRGRYIFAIHGTGEILSWVWDGTSVTSQVDLSDRFGSDFMYVTSIVEDQAGELYITTLDGGLYEIVPA